MQVSYRIFAVSAIVAGLCFAAASSASTVTERDRAEGDSVWIDPTTGAGGVRYEAEGNAAGKVRRERQRCDEDDKDCARRR